MVQVFWADQYVVANRQCNQVTHKEIKERIMRRFKQQQGMTAISWLLLLVWIITISLPTIKIVPMYINSLKISYALKMIESELFAKGKTITPEEIKNIGKNKQAQITAQQKINAIKLVTATTEQILISELSNQSMDAPSSKTY